VLTSAADLALSQAADTTSTTDYNLMLLTRSSTALFSVRGDGLVTATGSASLGTSASDLLTINSAITGATPLVLEGGCVQRHHLSLSLLLSLSLALSLSRSIALPFSRSLL
jgi:hypothetical protein